MLDLTLKVGIVLSFWGEAAELSDYTNTPTFILFFLEAVLLKYLDLHFQAINAIKPV